MSGLTKIFIVLMLVCSLASSVLMVTAIKKQENYRQQNESLAVTASGAQAALQKRTNELQLAQDQIATMSRDQVTNAGAASKALNEERQKLQAAALRADAAEAKIATAENKVAGLTAAVDALTKTNNQLQDEVRRMGPELVRLTTHNAELSRQNNELLTSNKFAEQSIRKLQEEISRLEAAAPKGGAGAATDSGTVASLTIQTPAQINGRVIDKKDMAGRTLIELPLGTRDGVRKGTSFVVSRGGNFIADAVVETVTPDASVAATKNLKNGETVKVGDIVTSGSPQ